MKHMMIDCETLGLRPGAVVLTIGAVTWDDTVATGTGAMSTFKARVDVFSCLMVGLHIEPTSLDWWRQQSPEAQAALYDGPALPLADALLMLKDHWHITGAERVWANGPVADIAWLEAAYRAVGLTPPWQYNQVRDFRTLLELDGLAPEARAVPAVKHDALADAMAQAQDAMGCLQRLGAAVGAAKQPVPSQGAFLFTAVGGGGAGAGQGPVAARGTGGLTLKQLMERPKIDTKQ